MRLFFFCLLFAISIHTNAQVSAGDSLALVHFFDSTGGNDWLVIKNWKKNVPVSRWAGVTIDTPSGRIKSIILPDNNLVGSLPYSITQLEGLTTLDLSNNKLNGGLQLPLHRLNKLKKIYLQKNNLSGSFPFIQSPIPLEEINFANNRLSGMLTDVFDNIPLLKNLDISNNQFTDTLPRSLRNLFFLNIVNFAGNRFSFTSLEKIAALVPNAFYKPQENIQLVRSDKKLIAIAGGTPKENSFYWYRNGLLDAITYADSVLELTDSGSYFVIVQNNIANEVSLFSNIVNCRQDWVMIVPDTTTDPEIKQNWKVNTLAYQNSGFITGVNAGGTFKNDSGNYYVHFWNRTNSLSSSKGNAGDGEVIKLITDNALMAGSPLYMLGYIDNETTQTTYCARKNDLSGWEIEPNMDVDDFVSNGLTHYANADMLDPSDPQSTLDAGIFQKDFNKGWKSVEDKIYNLNHLVDSLLQKELNDYDTHWLYDGIGMTTMVGGDLYIAGIATPQEPMTKPYKLKVVVVKYNSSEKNWSQLGHSFDDFSRDFASDDGNPVSTLISCNSIGTNVVVTGSFRNAAGKFYVAKYNSASNNWSQFGTWSNAIDQDFVLDMPILSMTQNGWDIYVSGFFLNERGNSFVIKMDILGNCSPLGNSQLTAPTINAICYGGRYVDDIYAGGFFSGKGNRTYMLAHYVPEDTSQLILTASTLLITDNTKVNFFANTANAGVKPLYVWLKNNTIVSFQRSYTYSDSTLRDGDIISCYVYRDNDYSIGPLFASVKMRVVPKRLLRISPGDTVDYGTPVTFKVLSSAGNNQNSSYQWRKNNKNVGTDSNIYTDSTLFNNDKIDCIVSIQDGTDQIKDTTGAVTMVVNVESYPVCPSANFNLSAGVSGSSYQWQMDSGAGFSNISDNQYFSGTAGSMLQVKGIPAQWYAYKLRCKVNGVTSKTYILKISTYWTGTVNNNWNNPANWSCGIVPDINTDVLIDFGTVSVNANAFCRSLSLLSMASVNVLPGIVLQVKQ